MPAAASSLERLLAGSARRRRAPAARAPATGSMQELAELLRALVVAPVADPDQVAGSSSPASADGTRACPPPRARSMPRAPSRRCQVEVADHAAVGEHAVVVAQIVRAPSPSGSVTLRWCVSWKNSRYAATRCAMLADAPHQLVRIPLVHEHHDRRRRAPRRGRAVEVVEAAAELRDRPRANSRDRRVAVLAHEVPQAPAVARLVDRARRARASTQLRRDAAQEMRVAVVPVGDQRMVKSTKRMRRLRSRPDRTGKPRDTLAAMRLGRERRGALAALRRAMRCRALGVGDEARAAPLRARSCVVGRRRRAPRRPRPRAGSGCRRAPARSRRARPRAQRARTARSAPAARRWRRARTSRRVVGAPKPAQHRAVAAACRRTRSPATYTGQSSRRRDRRHAPRCSSPRPTAGRRQDERLLRRRGGSRLRSARSAITRQSCERP